MLSIRPYSRADCDTLFDWRNHPDTRAKSFNSHPIDPGEHRAWFARFLEDSRRIGFFLEEDGIPVAHIRFDTVPVRGRLRISISTAPGQQGKGFGHELLSRACEHPETLSRGVLLAAETFIDNLPSQKIFERCSFFSLGERERGGERFIEWRRAIGPVLPLTRIILLNAIHNGNSHAKRVPSVALSGDTPHPGDTSEMDLAKNVGEFLERMGFVEPILQGSCENESLIHDPNVRVVVFEYPDLPKCTDLISCFERVFAGRAIRLSLSPQERDKIGQIVERLLDLLSEAVFSETLK
ncbi:MAG: GNAT family N-acetyltransferase [Candidatus Ozemobacteraceae bacterium]